MQRSDNWAAMRARTGKWRYRERLVLTDGSSALPSCSEPGARCHRSDSVSATRYQIQMADCASSNLQVSDPVSLLDNKEPSALAGCESSEQRNRNLIFHPPSAD